MSVFSAPSQVFAAWAGAQPESSAPACPDPRTSSRQRLSRVPVSDHDRAPALGLLTLFQSRIRGDGG